MLPNPGNPSLIRSALLDWRGRLDERPFDSEAGYIEREQGFGHPTSRIFIEEDPHAALAA